MLSKYFLEKDWCCNLLRSQNFLPGSSREISDIDKNVQSRNEEKRDGGTPSESFHRILRRLAFHMARRSSYDTWHTLISLTTANALEYPAYENINLTIAFVAPYALASEVPLHGSLQLPGSSTFVWPPKTTSPAIEILYCVNRGTAN